MLSRQFLVSRAQHILLLAIMLNCLCPPALALRKDIVVMTNGDHFTGQVKSLQNGLLYLETEYASGNIALDWKQVKSIESTATYRIVLNNGHRLLGKIEKNVADELHGTDILIHEATEQVRIAAPDVASLDTIKPTFWRQLQGSIDLGYSFTSGNGQSALNASTSAAYKTPAYEIATAFDSTFSGQSGSSDTNRQDLQAAYSKFLNRNSFVAGLSDFLHSSQQDLQLRTTLGGGYGRYLKRTPTSNLSWLGGLVFVKESFVTRAGRPEDQNLEGTLALQYSYMRFNYGEFDSQLQTFPGLTDSGRIRLKTNNQLTIKLRNNFRLNFTFWDNFDSQPPPTARRNELGMSSGIGWSF
jgi:putative salt-induced outer membrane protein YdiY